MKRNKRAFCTPCPAHVPRVACTLTRRPLPGRCMCHAWHAPPLCPAHLPRVACTPHAGRTRRRPPARCMCHAWLAPPHARRKCHTWLAWTPHAPPPCPAHVPHVARTPHAPPSARRTCHTWHARRTLRPLPGARATRGMYAARSAPARRKCHTWHARRRFRPCPAHVPHMALCSTRGISPQAPPSCLDHVPHVASRRTPRPWPS